MLILLMLSCRAPAPEGRPALEPAKAAVARVLSSPPAAFQAELARIQALTVACVKFGYTVDREKNNADFSVGIDHVLLLDGQGRFAVEPMDGSTRESWDGQSYFVDIGLNDPQLQTGEMLEVAAASLFLQSLLQGLLGAIWYEELPPNLFVLLGPTGMEWARALLPFVEDTQIWVGLRDGMLDKIIVGTPDEYVNILLGYRDWNSDLTPQDLGPDSSGGYWGNCELVDHPPSL